MEIKVMMVKYKGKSFIELDQVINMFQELSDKKKIPDQPSIDNLKKIRDDAKEAKAQDPQS